MSHYDSLDSFIEALAQLPTPRKVGATGAGAKLFPIMSNITFSAVSELETLGVADLNVDYLDTGIDGADYVAHTIIGAAGEKYLLRVLDEPSTDDYEIVSIVNLNTSASL